jgi:ribosomal protein S12 methylthiotransferase
LKTKSHRKPKVNVITLGCSKNIVDSEVLLAQLKGNDIPALHEAEEDASVIVINTCGFIDRAKEESINTILEYAEKKEQGEIEQLFVTGCLSERYREDLEKEIPIVDAWFGTMELPGLLHKLGADYKHELLGERTLTTQSHYAFLKISEGCDRPCSFCAIPLMRGKNQSRSIEFLTQEATFLVSKGVKEIILIAQDLTAYGMDLYGSRRLNDLLISLAGVPGLEWIRLQYAYPSQFPEEILDTMREYPNICKYLDMPLQHISDRMLKSMRRGITKRRTIELLETIRAKVPGITLRTTLIAGYPGETEEDFQELLDFVEEQKFDRLGVFPYSHEENTHAYTLEDDVPDEIKQERVSEIMEIQQDISERINEAKVGKVFKVIIDRKEGKFLIGRTESDSPEVDNEVIIRGNLHNAQPGDFVQVLIKEAEAFDLIGEITPA